ncbi:hypothetical protein ZWY2020_011207 [Hordeum vulgare]|nr:hypothetical protein ZWY2020_011207 [Hordeum vulgare]
MFDDQDLGFFTNFLGIFIFVLCWYRVPLCDGRPEVRELISFWFSKMRPYYTESI